jgi:hypothetical protein
LPARSPGVAVTRPHRRGSAEKNYENPTCICASSPNKARTYVLTFFFNAYLGVSRQGELKKHEEKRRRKIHPGDFFSGVFVFFFFAFGTFFGCAG